MSQYPPERPGEPYTGASPATTGVGGLQSSGAAGIGSSSGSGSTADVAKDEAAQTKDTAVEAGRDVAATAKEQASGVLSEAQDQAADLAGQLTEQVRSQGQDQQQRLVGGLQSASKELDQMAAGSEQSGLASEVTRQVSQGLSSAAGWLEDREPADVLEEVRGYARREPVTFLVGAALAGFLVGRIARGAVASRTELDSPSSSSGASHGFDREPSREAGTGQYAVHSGTSGLEQDWSGATAVPGGPVPTGGFPTEPSGRPASLVEEDTATPGAATGDPLPGEPVDPAADPWINDDRPDVNR